MLTSLILSFKFGLLEADVGCTGGRGAQVKQRLFNKGLVVILEVNL